MIGDDGSDESVTFAQMSARSTEVAAWLRAHGVERGHRVLLMLGNQVELWETMLACMKLGAVLIPATTLLTAADITDRVQRGRVSHVVTGPASTSAFEQVPGDYRRIVVGGSVPGWTDYPAAGQADADGPLDLTLEHGVTRGDDTLLLYFTSGTTAKPKLVEHTHVSYPVGHLSTMYWVGLRPGDVHLNISSPGWAKHAWSSFFAPWNAEATILVVNQARFDAARLLETMAAAGATTFCAPPTVYRMLIQQDLRALARPAVPARDGRCRRAAEPGGDRPGPRRAGADHPRRLRPDRDHPAGRQLPGPGGRAGLDGPRHARLRRGAAGPRDRRGAHGRRSRGRAVPAPVRARRTPGRADGRLPRGPRAQRRGDARRRLPHR